MSKTEWLKFYFPLHFLTGWGVNEDGQAQSEWREEMKRVWKYKLHSPPSNKEADSNATRW